MIDIDYQELCTYMPERFPRLADSLTDGEVEGKELILAYMKTKGEYGGMSPGFITDIFTGETVVGVCHNDLHDDVYSWSDEVTYYFERYNAKLPDDFVGHILPRVQ